MLEKPGENRQKYQKTIKNLKTGKKQKKISKNRQKYRKIVKNVGKCRKNQVRKSEI